MVTIYRSETVITKTEIPVDDAKQAIKFARAADGMPNRPEYEPHASRSVRFSDVDPTADEPKTATDDGKPADGAAKSGGAKATKDLFKK